MMVFSTISSYLFFFFSYACRRVPLKISSSESSSSRNRLGSRLNKFYFEVSIPSSSSIILIVFSGTISKVFLGSPGFLIYYLPSAPPIISISGSSAAISFFLTVSLTGDHDAQDETGFPFIYFSIDISVSIFDLAFPFFNSNSTNSLGLSTNLPLALS
jgi:hypothetical protein